jgi:hypothetical protein
LHDPYKNYFITYDTKGYDRTIRLWDLNVCNNGAGSTSGYDGCISSFTCPSRIVSCNLNVGPLYFGHENNKTDDILIAVSLYGIRQLLVLKLVSINDQNKNSKFPFEDDMFDANLNGIVKDINL